MKVQRPFPHTWESQFRQYPAEGPTGISYYEGNVDGLRVDCLLWRDASGKVRGILNHFPQDMGPERAGNVFVIVNPVFRRQGIAMQLIKAAHRCWRLNWGQQSYTADGEALAAALKGEVMGRKDGGG